MLYVTTGAGQDAYTANRALSEDRCPAGGFYVPMRMPRFQEDQIAALAEKPFSQNVAEILNLLFGTRLDGWAVEFGIGRYPVKLVSLSGKITVAEAWHNPVWKFERLANGIEKAIRQSDQISKTPTDWLLIASRCAVLFGIYGQLLHSGVLTTGQKLDIAVACADLSALMAAWYARNWGLPVRTIVCCCKEGSSIWSLLHKGELRADAQSFPAHNSCGEDAVPGDLERLIFAVLGPAETERFREIIRVGGMYRLEPEQVKQLRQGIHVSVVSDKRVASMVPNLYMTTGFVAAPSTALACSGLIDYRAAAGESHPALIMEEESPIFSLQYVAESMNISPEELKLLLDE